MKNLIPLLCLGLLLPAFVPDQAQARPRKKGRSYNVTLRVKYRGKWYTYDHYTKRGMANSVDRIRSEDGKSRDLIWNTVVSKHGKDRSRLSLQYQLEFGALTKRGKSPIQIQAQVIVPKGREVLLAKGYGWKVLTTVGRASEENDEEEAPAKYPGGNYVVQARVTHLGKTYYVRKAIEPGTQSNFVGSVRAKKAKERLMIINSLLSDDQGGISMQYQTEFSQTTRNVIFQVQGETKLQNGVEKLVKKGRKWELKLKATRTD
ncbi:hypothetical protein ACFL2T_04000 [Elusimicrobiota bacterium]